MSTQPKLNKAKIEDTAKLLWVSDQGKTPIKLGSSEWNKYLEKAERVLGVPVIVDTKESDLLYKDLKKALTAPQLEKVWQVVLEHRYRYLNTMKTLFERASWDNKYINDAYKEVFQEANLWDEDSDDDYEPELTEEGQEYLDIVNDYLCTEQLGQKIDIR